MAGTPPDLSSGPGSAPDLSDYEDLANLTAGSCCREKCLVAFASGPLLEAWEDWNATVVCNGSRDHHLDCVFQLVRQLMQGTTTTRVKFNFLASTFAVLLGAGSLKSIRRCW